MQRNFDFSASFNAYYLVNPNNLLTHTHTHTHLAHLAFKRLHVRARGARVTSINKGLLGVPFVRIFVSLYEQKMNEIKEQNVGMHGSCVRSSRVDELAINRYWSGRTNRASLHAFANKKTQKEANEKTQEYVGTHGSCVRLPRVDELAVNRYWSGRTNRASLHAPCTQRNKENKRISTL